MKNSKSILLALGLLILNVAHAQTSSSNEIIEKRTANSKHFPLGNGKFSAIISGQNIHYKNERGSWEDINTTVVPTIKASYLFENTTNSFLSYFGQTEVLIEKDKQQIKMGVNPKVLWIEKLGEEKVIEMGHLSQIKRNKNTVSYSNAFTFGCIDYVVENESIKNNLVLNYLPTSLVKKTGYLGFSEEIILPKGWMIIENINEKNQTIGSLRIVNANKKTVCIVPAPVAFDQAYNSPDVDGAGNAKMGYKLVKTKEGYQLITLVDLAWLNREETQYPVTIDPTLTFAGTHGGWQNSASSYLESASPFIYVFAGVNTSGSIYSSWIKFNVSSLGSCAVIDSVSTQLEMNFTGSSTTTEIVNINDVTGAYGPYAGYNAAAFADLANGLYTSFPALAAGTYGYYYLGGQAAIDLTSHLTSGFFQLGFNISSPTTYKRFTTQLSNLKVVYTPGTGATSGNAVVTACDSYTWINGVTYTSNNNTATHVILGGNSVGCDSTVHLNLTLLQSTGSVQSITSCSPITWLNGVTYSSSNSTATHVLPGANSIGCDSIITLNFTKLPSSSSTVFVFACAPYIWIDGNSYSSNGTATHVLPGASANGCDSIVTMVLTIYQPQTTTQSVTACGSYTWIDGNTYTSSNSTATYSILNSSGCDSIIVNLALTIVPMPNVTVTQSGATLTATSASATYQWLNCATQMPIPGATSFVYTPSTSGNYAVVVTQSGCSDTSACFLVDYTGLSEIDDQIVIVYPNPSNTGVFKIQHDGDLSMVQLFDLIGRKVEIEVNLSSGEINASKLGAGKYVLRFWLNGKEMIKEIVIL